MPGGAVARVLIDSPLPQLDQLFDYAVPARLADAAKAGVRVKVPLRTGGRIADGWIVELADTSEYQGALSELEDVVSVVALLRPEVWALARAAADRAAGNASDVLRLAVPSRYVRVERSWLAAEPDPGPLPTGLPAIPGAKPGRLEAGIADGERMTLAADPRPVRLPTGEWVGAWAAILAQAAAHALAADRSALLVVPDYRDQAQLEAALAASVDPRRVLRADARQSGGDRYRAFLEATRADARIIVGNRSTVYSPAARLGLIAIWDDGDPLLAEPLAPGVHARDAALIRQEQSGAALLLVGHTRSVEVQRLVEIGWVHEVAPSKHVRPRVIPTEQQANPDPGSARIPTIAWRQAQDAVREGPVLVQVARLGNAPLLACDRCREPARCAACGGGLAVPREGGTARCVLCGTSASGWRCPVCDGTKLRAVTIGASRTADELGRAFPNTRVILSDGERPVLRVGAEPAGRHQAGDGPHSPAQQREGPREGSLAGRDGAHDPDAPAQSLLLLGEGGDQSLEVGVPAGRGLERRARDHDLAVAIGALAQPRDALGQGQHVLRRVVPVSERGAGRPPALRHRPRMRARPVRSDATRCRGPLR